MSLSTNSSSFELLNGHPLPTWVVDLHNFEIKFSNTAAISYYGFSKEEFEKNNFLNLFTEDSRIEFFYKTTLQSDPLNFNGIYKHCKKNAAVFLIELYTSQFLVDDNCYHQVSVVDVTDNILARKKLEEDKERYRTYIEQSSDGIFCQELKVPLSVHENLDQLLIQAEKNKYLADCNHAMVEMHGYVSTEEMKEDLSNKFLFYDAAGNVEYLKNFFLNGFRLTNAESQEKNRHGETNYFLTNAFGIVEDGYLKRVWGTQRDITKKKNNEEKIRLLANLVEQTSDILTAADLEFKPITWNKAAEKTYGLTSEQVIGKNIRNYIDITYQNATKEEVRNIISKEGEWRGEMYFRSAKDNKPVTLIANFKLLRDENEIPIGYIIAATDITERKKAELRLKETEDRFKEVADSAPVMIWMADKNNRTTYVNKSWIEFTGIHRNELDKLEWSTIVHKDDVQIAIVAFNEAFNKQEIFKQHYRMLHHSGEFRWVQDTSIPRILEDGTFIGYISSFADIHDQKKIVDQLRFQANILENVSDVIVTTDLKFRVRAWNKVAEKYFGISEVQAIGKNLVQIVPFNFSGTTLEQVVIDLQKKGIWNGEVSVAGKNGESKYFLYTIKYVYDDNGNKIGFLSIGRDITDRKKIEKQLLKSEQFYRTLTADSLDGMILVNVDGFIRFCSPSVKNVLGFDVDQVEGRNAFEFVHPDDHALALSSFQNEVIEHPEIKFISIRLLKKNGEWLWCMVRGHNLLQKQFIQGVAVYFHDDSLRKKSNDALKESELRFRNLIRDLQIGIILLDNEGKTILCNKTFTKIFLVEEEELIGKTFKTIAIDPIHEDGRKFELEERPTNKALQTRMPVKDLVMGIYRPLQKERIWILVNADPILDDAGGIIHIICSMKDITDRKRMEEEQLFKQVNHQKQLTQATIDGQENERKEIGKELHDNIGQKLTTIKLFLDMAKSTADDSTVEMVNLALKNISDVINEIRSMSRALVPSTLKDLGLTDSINELVDSMMRTQLMEIQFDFLEFDEDQMPENQKLTLFRIVQEQLNNIIKHAEAKNVWIELDNRNDKVVLQIRDDGNGFDMKKVRKGIGFVNIQNRAELFGGHAEIISEPGKGCLLKVSFPQIIAKSLIC